MFGRYRIEGLLGRGGMGEVRRAYDTEHERVVALKRLSVVAADDQAKARFRRESRIAASLSGPHVTTIYDYGEIDGQLFLAMRLVEGTDLRRLLDDGPLPATRALEILSQVASALDTAHAAGVVHRDVKPSNILLDESGSAFLADFGIAKSLSPDATSVTHTGEIGTLDYMAPERLLHQAADHRADVYALACVLFECLTGKKPFPAEDSAGKLAAQLNDPPPAPSLFDWRIPRAVDLILATGMDKDPERRYPSAGELLSAATTAFRQLSVTAQLTSPERADNPGQGHILNAIVAVAARQQRPATSAADECPYPGLRSFSAADTGVFCGREHAVSDVLVRLSRQSHTTGPLLIVGASGTGKSSLLRAGVLPALTAAETPGDSGRWPQVVMTPGPNPIGTLAARLAPIAHADADALAHWMHTRPTEFGKLCWQITRTTDSANDRLVIVVDQFEELFTHGAMHPQRDTFATLLANAWPALVVLAIRADFIDQCLRLRALEPALANPYPLGPLAARDLERVITEPARAAGLHIEDGLTDRLITDIGASDGSGYDPGALPRLAHALRETWQNRSGSLLTLKGYQDTGGVDRAVALTADRVHNTLSEPDRQLLKTALLRMVTVLDTGGVARRKANRHEIPDHILARLVSARLVTAEADGVQLSHDALLTAWPRLREWVEQDRQGLILRQHLVQSAKNWHTSGHDHGELYRGTRLAATLDWANTRTDLTDTERAFLRESKRAQQRATRRLRGLATGLAAFLVLALAAGAIAAVKWGDATREADNARRAASVSESRRLAAESLAEAAADPVGARHKALQAWHASQTPAARGALLSNTTYDYPVVFDTGLDSAFAVDISPDGRLVAIGDREGQVVVVDTETGKPVDGGFDGHKKQIEDIAFSPDGKLLATATVADEPGVRVWDVLSGRQVSALNGAFSTFLTWHPDSRLLAALGTPDGNAAQVGAWDPRTGERVAWLTQPYPNKLQLPLEGAYGPNGDRLAVGRNDAVVDLWDTATATLVHSATAHRRAGTTTEQTVVQVAFSAGRLASASSMDGRIRFADPVTGKPKGRAIDAAFRSNDLEFTPDGGHVLTVAKDSVRVDMWNVATPQWVGAYAQGPAREGIVRIVIDPLAVAATGDTVAAQADGDIVLWRRNPGRHFEPTGPVHDLVFDRDGERLTALAADRVYLGDPTTGEPLATLPGASPFAVAYLKDGTRITGNWNGTVTLTDPDGGDDRTIQVEPNPVGRGDIVVAPDGKTFAVRTGVPVPDRKDTFQSTVSVWDGETLKQRASLKLGLQTGGTPVFAPDGDTLAVAVDAPVEENPDKTEHRIKRWRTSDFTALKEIRVDTQTPLAYTPDGSAMVTAKDDKIQVRDAETGAVRREFGAHPSEVRVLALSPDGRTLAAATVSDPTIRLWDLTTGNQLATLEGHRDVINFLAFSPDGDWLASSSADTDVRMWPADPDDAARQLCDDLADARVRDLSKLGCAD